MDIDSHESTAGNSASRFGLSAAITIVGLALSWPTLAGDCPTQAVVDGSIIYAAPAAGPAYFGDTPVTAVTLQTALNRVAQGPGRVVQLVANTRGGQAVFDKHQENEAASGNTPTAYAYLLRQAKGQPDRPIVICGQGVDTLIVGRSLEALKQELKPSGGMLAKIKSLVTGLISQAQAPTPAPTLRVAARRPHDMLDTLADEPTGNARAPGNWPLSLGDPAAEPRLVRCLRVESSSWVVFENIAFEECWMTAVYVGGGSYLTFRKLKVIGSSYAIVAFNGADAKQDPAHHLLIEDNQWIQDTSKFATPTLRRPAAPAPPGNDPCRQPYAVEDDCPGEVWRSVPWDVTHHGSWEPYNGALFGMANGLGGIVFRRNTIRNSYNGIRLTAKKCPFGSCNLNVEIYENDFAYVRDNPIEAEHVAHNWRIFHNHIRNAHGWLSFDGAADGPVYVFGNTGHFTETPEDQCGLSDPRTGKPWTADRYFHFGKLEPGERRDRPTEEAEKIRCDHKRGSVLKFGVPEVPDDYKCGDKPKDINCYRYLRNGLYVFNNSWYVRSPLAASGYAINLQHWNNAVEYCPTPASGPCHALAVPQGTATPGYEPKCDTQDPALVKHYGLGPLYLKPPATPNLVFDCFRADATTRFDFDVMSGVKTLVDFLPTATPPHQANGLDDLPGFTDGTRGRFTLKGDSPLRDPRYRGCSVAYAPATDPPQLTCAPGAADAPYRGAYQADDKRHPGPGYRVAQPEPADRKRYNEYPRIVGAISSGKPDSGTLLAVEFSVPVLWPSGRTLTVKNGAQDVIATRCDLEAAGTKINCLFAEQVDAFAPGATVVLPAGIVATGEPLLPLVTWASQPGNVVIR